MYIQYEVSGAAGNPSQSWERPVYWLQSNIWLRAAGVKHIDRDAAESEADRSADAPSRRKAAAPEATNGDKQTNTGALDGEQEEKREI